MRITIGTNSLEVISAGAKKTQNGKIIVIVEAKQELISHDDFRALFKDTTEDLVISRDDGTTETYGGCHYFVKVADDVKKMVDDEAGEMVEVEIHRAEIECTSEADFQLGRLRGMINTQNTTIKTQEQEILSQKAVIESLNQQLLVVQMAAADLYEKSLAAESTEETTEEPAEEITEEEELEYYSNLEQEAYDEMLAMEETEESETEESEVQ